MKTEQAKTKPAAEEVRFGNISAAIWRNEAEGNWYNVTVERSYRDRRLLHLINLSGHSQTGYFAPVPMGEIEVEVDGEYRKARSEGQGGELKVSVREGKTRVVVRGLREYEVVVLERR